MSVDQQAPSVELAEWIDESLALLDVLRWAVREAALTGETADVLIARRYPGLAGQYAWAPNFCAGSH